MSFPLLSFIILMMLSIIISNAHLLAVLGLSYWLIFLLGFKFGCQLNIKFYKQPEVIAFLVFCFYALFSLLWSPWDNQDLLVKELIRILCVIGMIMLFGFISTDTKLINLDYYFIITTSVYGVYLIVYVFTHLTPDFSYSSLQHIILRKSDGSFSHHALIGWLYSMSVILAISRMICCVSEKIKKPSSSFGVVVSCKKVNMLLLISCIISLMVIIIAQSRGAYIGLIAGILSLVLLKGGRYKKYAVVIMLLLGGAFIAVYQFMDFYLIDSLIQKADNGRFGIYKNAMVAIKEAPLLGHGFAASSMTSNTFNATVAHYHSLYLNILFFGGLLGYISFIIMLTIFLSRNSKYYGWYSVIVMSSVIFVVDVQRILMFPRTELFMFGMAILITVSLRMQKMTYR